MTIRVLKSINLRKRTVIRKHSLYGENTSLALLKLFIIVIERYHTFDAP